MPNNPCHRLPIFLLNAVNCALNILNWLAGLSIVLAKSPCANEACLNTTIYLAIIFSACDNCFVLLSIPNSSSNGSSDCCVISKPKSRSGLVCPDKPALSFCIAFSGSMLYKEDKSYPNFVKFSDIL